MKTNWQKEMTSEQPLEFEQVNPTTYIQRKNIEENPNEDQGGFICESRFISNDVYEALMEEYDSPAYKAILDQNETMDEANALLMLAQEEIQETQADQDETLALILMNTEKEGI